MTKVYVLETGIYENRGVSGIFASAELAMGAAVEPLGKLTVWKKTTWTRHPNWPDRSVVEHWVSWDNNHDRDYAASVHEYDLIDGGPVHDVDTAVVQTYRESDGGWDYVPESR